MTSLQQAAAGGVSFASSSSSGVRRPRPTQTNNNNMLLQQQQQQRGGGIFEASFGGLDLSEFGGASTVVSSQASGSNRPSAAAQLLQQKTIEAQRAHHEDEAEAIMQANAMALAQEQSKRLALLKQRHDVEGESNGKIVVSDSDLANRPVEGTEFLGRGMFSTLVRMHGNDDHGAKREVTSSGNKAKSASTVKRTVAPSGRQSSKRISRLSKVTARGAKGGKSNPSNKKGQQKGLVRRGRRTKY